MGATGTALTDLTPSAIAWGLSLNALTGVAATRFQARTGHAGLWLLGTGVAALAMGTVVTEILFYVIMAWWGFAFWMGIPAVFRLLAERSLAPRERVGDAQSLMALGRVVGPLIAGAAVGAGQFARLSVVGASIMFTGALTVMLVEGIRRRA